MNGAPDWTFGDLVVLAFSSLCIGLGLYGILRALATMLATLQRKGKS